MSTLNKTWKWSQESKIKKSIQMKEIYSDETKTPNWIGDDVSYSRLHRWVIKHLGQPDVCENCGKSNLTGRYIQWSNISGEYKRELSDWARLCVRCHHLIDNISYKVWKTRREGIV